MHNWSISHLTHSIGRWSCTGLFWRPLNRVFMSFLRWCGSSSLRSHVESFLHYVLLECVSIQRSSYQKHALVNAPGIALSVTSGVPSFACPVVLVYWRHHMQALCDKRIEVGYHSSPNKMSLTISLRALPRSWSMARCALRSNKFLVLG